MTERSIGLSIYRVVLTFLVVKSCLFYFPAAETLFGNTGMFPVDGYESILNASHLDYLRYDFSSPLRVHLFLGLLLVFSILFLFGEFGWVGGIGLYIFYIILRARNPFIMDGSDNVIQVTLPFLIFSDAYCYATTDYYKRIGFVSKLLNRSSTWVTAVNKVAVWGIIIQIVYVYFFTALAKAQGNLWMNGTATYYTMRVDEFRATSWNIAITRNHYFVVLSTYFTLLWEMAFPFLIWFRQTKYWILCAGILLHVGIFIFMRIDNFSWIMIGSYAVFLKNDEYKRIADLFFTKLPKLKMLLR